jgi:hypothetical protein
VPRTWAIVGPHAEVDMTVIEQSDGTDMLEAVIVESAEPESGSDPPQRPWKIRMKNPPDAKPPEPAYHDLPWLFPTREAAEAAIWDWKNGSIDPDVTAGESAQGR